MVHFHTLAVKLALIHNCAGMRIDSFSLLWAKEIILALLIHIQAVYVQGWRAHEKDTFHRYSHGNGEHMRIAIQITKRVYVLTSVVLSMETRFSVLRCQHFN